LDKRERGNKNQGRDAWGRNEKDRTRPKLLRGREERDDLRGATRRSWVRDFSLAKMRSARGPRCANMKEVRENLEVEGGGKQYMLSLPGGGESFRWKRGGGAVNAKSQL